MGGSIVLSLSDWIEFVRFCRFLARGAKCHERFRACFKTRENGFVLRNSSCMSIEWVFIDQCNVWAMDKARVKSLKKNIFERVGFLYGILHAQMIAYFGEQNSFLASIYEYPVGNRQLINLDWNLSVDSKPARCLMNCNLNHQSENIRLKFFPEYISGYAFLSGMNAFSCGILKNFAKFFSSKMNIAGIEANRGPFGESWGHKFRKGV